MSILDIFNIENEESILLMINEMGIPYMNGCIEKYYLIKDDDDKKELCDNVKNSLITYTYILFLDESNECNIDKMIINILDNDTDVIFDFINNNWNHIEINTFLNMFLCKMLKIKFSIEELYKIYKVLLNKNRKNIINSILQSNYWFFETGYENHVSFLGKIFNSFSLENNWKKNLQIAHKIILKLLKIREYKKEVIKWLYDIYHQNISKKHIEFDVKLLSDDMFLLNILGFLLILWKNGRLEKKITAIDIEFEFNKEYTKNKFFTECFYMIHNFIEISFNSLYEKKNIYLDNIELLTSSFLLLSDINADNILNLFKIMQMNNLKKKLETYKIKLKDINFILKYKYLLNELNIFFEDNLKFLKNICIEKIEEKCNEKILNNVIYFYNKNNCKDHKLFIEITILLVDSKLNNPYTKSKYIKKLSNIIYNNHNYDTNPKLVSMLINFFNNTENYEQYHDKYIIRYNIICLLKYLILDYGEYYDSIIDFCENKKNIFKKFINLILSDVNFYLDESFLNIYKISDDKFYSSCKALLICGNEILNSVLFFTKIQNKIFVEDEIVPKVTNILIFYIKKILDVVKKLDIISNEKKSIISKIITILYKLSKIFINLSQIEKFIKYISINKNSYYSTMFSEVIDIINKNNTELMTWNYTKKLYEIEENINIRIKDHELEESFYDTIPDQFCDPLMATPITNPIALPNTSIIMDKKVIARHLLTYNFNPFNREELTMKMLEEYNETLEGKEKIKEFNDKFEEWKNRNK